MKVTLDPNAYWPEATVQPVNATRPLTWEEQHVVRGLEARLRDDAAAIATALKTGVPADLPSYREMVGELRGLNTALELLRIVETESRQGGEAVVKPETPLYVA